MEPKIAIPQLGAEREQAMCFSITNFDATIRRFTLPKTSPQIRRKIEFECESLPCMLTGLELSSVLPGDLSK